MKEFDEIIITGHSSSPIGDYIDLKCIIATVSEDAIKVWVDEDRDVEKIWFYNKDIVSLTIICEDV